MKPANLLLEPSPVGAPHVRLADFGIALGDDGLRFTTTGFTVGTPGYLAPEVLEWNRPGPRQDLYAAGLVGWRMLTGAGDPETAAAGGAAARAPPVLWAVVARLCAEDPERRPHDPDAARRALAACGFELRFPSGRWTASRSRSSTSWGRRPAERHDREAETTTRRFFARAFGSSEPSGRVLGTASFVPP